MEDTGGLKWWIVLCLFAAWAIVFLIVMKGIQSSGNVSNFNPHTNRLLQIYGLYDAIKLVYSCLQTSSAFLN